MLGFLVRDGSGGGGSGLFRKLLSAPASNELVETRLDFLSSFFLAFPSFDFFPFSFVLIVAVVADFVSVFVCGMFASLPSFVSVLSEPRFAQLFILAIERMLRIARNAMEPWPWD